MSEAGRSDSPAARLDAVAAMDATAAREAVSELLRDPEWVEAARDAWGGAGRYGLEAALMALGSTRGLGQVARDLRSAISARPAQQQVRLAGQDERQPVGVSWSGLPAGMMAPIGYVVDSSGVWRQDPEKGPRRIAARPILVTGRLLDVESGQVHVRVRWGERQERTVPRRTICDARAIVALSDDGAPVSSGTAADLVRYLTAQEEDAMEDLDAGRCASRLGWHQDGDRWVYLWGRHLLGGDGEITLLDDQGTLGQYAGACVESGTWETWLSEVYEPARRYPSALLGIYAALVPPLLRWCRGAPGFVVDWSGVTSRGKSTTLRLAGSVWGYADETAASLVRTWDTTDVGTEAALAAIGDCCPLILDDTRRATRPEVVGRVLYQVAAGVGRARGRRDGGGRPVASWRTVLLSTGEHPAVELGEMGGARARTLSLWGSPWGDPSEETGVVVDRIRRGALRHHGHLGPRMIRVLLQPGARELADRGYLDALVDLQRQAGGDPVRRRAAEYVALLRVAAEIAHGACELPPPIDCDPLAVAWAAAGESSQESDRALAALVQVVAWATSQQARFDGRGELDTTSRASPHGGWLGWWSEGEGSWSRLAILPPVLRAQLADFKHDLSVLRTWQERGWLESDSTRHASVKVRVGDRRVRCYCLTRAACEAAGGERQREIPF